MIEIDGSQGEGGGQIVRSSLALSAITTQPFTISKVRAGRKKPGLMRQHLTALNAAKAICNADVVGAEVGSQEIEFHPSKVQPGKYAFQVGTAGSITLVAQTVIPALMLADGPSHIELVGGTHNEFAPPFHYLKKAYLPIVSRMGPKFDPQLEVYGFYPAGGGKFSVSIIPSESLKGIEIVKTPKRTLPHVKAVVSKIPIGVAERECSTIRKKANWNLSAFESVEVTNSPGPGNVIMISLESEEVTELFTGFGKIGVRAEQVARNVLRDARKYIQSGVPVGPHLSDQLLLPMGLAAAQGNVSQFRCGPLTQHSKTHIEILKRFLPIEIDLADQDDDSILVTVRPAEG